VSKLGRDFIIMITVNCPTESDTLALAQRVGELTQPGDCLLLHGDLGAGKTRFVRGLARGIGIDPRAVSSPTYVLLQEYEPDDASCATPLIHIDAYRLRDPEEAITLGWNSDALREAVVAVEWPSQLPPPQGFAVLVVEIDHADTGRVITLTGDEKWEPRLQNL